MQYAAFFEYYHPNFTKFALLPESAGDSRRQCEQSAVPVATFCITNFKKIFTGAKKPPV